MGKGGTRREGNCIFCFGVVFDLGKGKLPQTDTVDRRSAALVIFQSRLKATAVFKKSDFQVKT